MGGRVDDSSCSEPLLSEPPPKEQQQQSIARNEYANSRPMQQQQRTTNRPQQRHRNISTSATEGDFFKHSGTTLEATIDLFHEMFSHLTSKLAWSPSQQQSEQSANGWIDRLISYWAELGIDQSTISTTLNHLRINSANIEESDNAVRLLLQRFAEALTGICLAHPCSTVIFLTAFDELKATRQDASDATEQRRQAESELGECRRRIALLADEADERCRTAEAASAEKLKACQKSSVSAIVQMRAELEVERNSWLSEREAMLNESRQQTELLEKLRKKFDEESAECTYWKQQANNQLRENASAVGNDRQWAAGTTNTVRFRLKRTRAGSSSESESSIANDDNKEHSSDEKGDLRSQLDTQLTVNKVLTGEIARLEEQLAAQLLKQQQEDQDYAKDDQKVIREDSGLGMAPQATTKTTTATANKNSINRTQADGAGGISCFDLLYGNNEDQQCGIWTNGEFEALEAACSASPVALVDAETQCSITPKTKSKSCQVNFFQVTELDCERLTRAVEHLESNLAESVAAFNSLRSRYHKQLVRTNQLIDLTNELYAENRRLHTLISPSPTKRQPASRCSTSFEDSNESSSCGEERTAKLLAPTPVNNSKGKRRVKHEEIYVVVGQLPNLKQHLSLQ